MAKPWAKAFYNSMAWRYARKQALARDHHTCAYCGARATEVHHITELTPDNITDPTVSLNLRNMQSLCHDCHRTITMQEHGLADIDCDMMYFFDDDGQLSPRGG